MNDSGREAPQLPFARLTCVPCGYLAIPDQDPTLALRAPEACPACGESNFHCQVLFTESMSLRDSMAYVARGPRKGKARERILSGKVGSEFHSLTGRWHGVTRRIDPVNDTYDEVILDDEIGEAVREVHEPLTEHRGRGSARHRWVGDKPGDEYGR